MNPSKIAIAFGCLAVAGLGAEAKLTTSELDRASIYLQQTQTMVLGATEGLSDEQWNFKPAPDRWSIAEIVEHMVLTQAFFLGPVRESLAKAPAPRTTDTASVDQAVINQVPDRTAKFQAPEFLRPTGRWTPAESMDRLMKNYAELTTYLKTAPDLRQHAVEAPALKAVSKGAYSTMDGYESILLTAAHTERHTKQILEVRADAKFPSK